MRQLPHTLHNIALIYRHYPSQNCPWEVIPPPPWIKLVWFLREQLRTAAMAHPSGCCSTETINSTARAPATMASPGRLTVHCWSSVRSLVDYKHRQLWREAETTPESPAAPVQNTSRAVQVAAGIFFTSCTSTQCRSLCETPLKPHKNFDLQQKR